MWKFSNTYPDLEVTEDNSRTGYKTRPHLFYFPCVQPLLCGNGYPPNTKSTLTSTYLYNFGLLLLPRVSFHRSIQQSHDFLEFSTYYLPKVFYSEFLSDPKPYHLSSLYLCYSVLGPNSTRSLLMFFLLIIWTIISSWQGVKSLFHPRSFKILSCLNFTFEC